MNKTYEQLLSLRDRAGRLHYERVALADKLLKDQAWVRSPEGGGGDENRAYTKLDQECFGDLSGLGWSIEDLLDVYRAYPDENEWKRHKYDLGKMWEELRARRRQSRAAARAKVGPSVREMGRYHTPEEFTGLTPAQMVREYTRVYRALMAAEQKLRPRRAGTAA